MFTTALPTGRRMEVELMIKQSDFYANYESEVRELAEFLKPIPKQKKKSSITNNQKRK